MTGILARLRLTPLVLAAALSLLIAPGGAVPARAQAGERYAAILVDAKTGEVLFAHDADEVRYPASLTKVMTLYLLFEAMAEGRVQPEDRIRVSPRAASQPPSKLGLAAGQTLSVDEAIRALTVRSCNDIAVAVAEHLSGSVEAFAKRSTARAAALGLTQTRFVNPHGLPDPEHVSSARDLLRLSRAVMRDFPQYYDYFGLREWAHEGRVLRNTNGLLHAYADYDGLKTGFTRASGFNLAASATRGDRRLIAVVLGGSTTQARNAHVADLIATGFEVERLRAEGRLGGSSQAAFEARGFGEERTASDGPVPYALAR
ncbi:MAG: D-alanyl-D-alanine carboxypeptidase family protein [Brevundimonas sp.]